jgi:hypothetical protein
VRFVCLGQSMRRRSPARWFMVSFLLSILVLALGQLPAKADGVPVTMEVNAGGSGTGPESGSMSEAITGTFEFDPNTLTISNVQLSGSLTVYSPVGFPDGTVIEFPPESWAFGPISPSFTGNPGEDTFSWAGNVGSLGDVLEFVVVLYSDGSGGFVPAGGSGAVRSGNSSTVYLGELDSWSGTVTDVTPEPSAAIFFGCGMLLFFLRKGPLRKLNTWVRNRDTLF